LRAIGPAEDVEFAPDNFLPLLSAEGQNEGDAWSVTGIHLLDDGTFIGMDGSASCDYTGFD
jgi:hypothetical protein